MARRPPVVRPLLALALALTAAVAGCSDDDAADATSSSTTASGASSSTPGGALREIELAGRPSAVTVVQGDLWVADDDTGDALRAGVRHLDPETGDLIALAGVRPASPPVALVALDDAVWVVGARGVLTKISAASDESVAEVDIGGAPVDGVLAGDRLWVADIERSLVHVLDPETGEVVADPVAVPAGAVRLVAAGERLWVSGLEDQVTPIDMAALVARQPVTVGRAPIGMAIAADVLWVANSEDDTVSRVSLETGQLVGEPLAVGNAPIAVVVDGPGAWVLNQDDATLLRLDVETGEPIGAPVELPMRPRGMAVTADGVWVVGVDPSAAVLVPSQ